MRRSTMLLTSTGLLAITTAFAFSVSACGGSDQQPATAPSSAYPQQQYPQQQYPQQQYPQQQYPQQQYPQQQYPQQQYPQTQPTAAPTATMATPGPLALPCQNDGACGLHRCNTQFQKCAFPCQSEADCAQGNQCMMGVCAPKMGP